MISTAEARNEVAKTDVSIMGRPYRDVRTTFRETHSPWIQLHVACREQHRHTVAGQLVEHDHLVGVDAGEAIRRQAPYGVEEPRLGRVTKSIEVGAIQAGTGVPVIDELCDQLVALGIGPLTQRGDLGADGAPGFLGLGRDPCIDGHSHRHASSLITVSSPGKASSSS
jgi:hypothetical protein